MNGNIICGSIVRVISRYIIITQCSSQKLVSQQFLTHFNVAPCTGHIKGRVSTLHIDKTVLRKTVTEQRKVIVSSSRVRVKYHAAAVAKAKHTVKFDRLRKNT